MPDERCRAISRVVSPSVPSWGRRIHGGMAASSSLELEAWRHGGLHAMSQPSLHASGIHASGGAEAYLARGMHRHPAVAKMHADACRCVPRAPDARSSGASRSGRKHAPLARSRGFRGSRSGRPRGAALAAPAAPPLAFGGQRSYRSLMEPPASGLCCFIPPTRQGARTRDVKGQGA